MDYTVTRGSVSQHASELLRIHLRLRDFSPTCTVGTVLAVLFCACSRLCSLTAACFSLRLAPSREAVLKRLLKRLSQLGIRVRMLLLDRGFWSVAVIRYLQAARRPFLMPVVLRGRPADHPQGPGGTRVFAIRTSGGFDEYRVTAANKQTARVRICIHCRNYNGQWGRHGRQTLVYAFWGIEPSSTRWVRETYRKRFAIETSYRQL